jgi:hypothetical protein
MAEYDRGIKLIADTSSRELARVAGVECSRLQPLNDRARSCDKSGLRCGTVSRPCHGC